MSWVLTGLLDCCVGEQAELWPGQSQETSSQDLQLSRSEKGQYGHSARGAKNREDLGKIFKKPPADFLDASNEIERKIATKEQPNV